MGKLEATCKECNNTETFAAKEIEDVGELTSYLGDGEWAVFSQCPDCLALGTLIVSTNVTRVQQ